MKYAYVLIFALVLVAGCTGLPFGIFGADVINLQKTVVLEDPKDIVTVPTIVTLPNPPLLPDQEFTVSMVLENRDELKPANRVKVDLFNAPTFKDMNGQLCNQQSASLGTGACIPDQCSVRSPCELLPGEQKQLHFYLKTPSEAEIANIRTETTLDIKTLYEFDGSLVLIAPLVNVDEVVRLQTEGGKLGVEESKLQGSGPLVIDTEFVGAPYILSNSAGSSAGAQKSIIRFTIKNRGSGSVKDNIIPSMGTFRPSFDLQGNIANPGAVKGIAILFPSELKLDRTKIPNNFDCSAPAPGTLCVNAQDIQIFKDESRVSMRFEFTPDQLPPGTPFRSTTIKAYVWYDYELRNSVSVSINPFQNI